MYIRTERTNIRPLLISDADDLCALCSSEEAMEFMPPVFGPESPAQTLQRLKRYIAHDEEHGISFGHVSLKNGQFIGRAGFSFIPDVNLYEIGYSLLPQYWHQGLATEITEGLLDYAFYSLNLDMICARTILGNHRSDSVLQKTGFNLLGERAFAEGDRLHLWNYYECDNPEMLQNTTIHNMAAVEDDGWEI